MGPFLSSWKMLKTGTGSAAAGHLMGKAKKVKRQGGENLL
jgi:hypothetical protein